MCSNVEAVILLLTAGADVNIKCNVSKRTSTYARVSMSASTLLLMAAYIKAVQPL